MNTVHKHNVGMAAGIVSALAHAVWSFVVAVMPDVAQQMINWKLALHGLNIPVQVMSFGLGNAVVFIVMSFVGGYIAGYVFAAIYNWQAARKRSK